MAEGKCHNRIFGSGEWRDLGLRDTVIVQKMAWCNLKFFGNDNFRGFC